MNLSKTQRETILHNIVETQKAIETAKTLIRQAVQNKDTDLAQSCEILEWMENQRLETLKTALIENEIDY